MSYVKTALALDKIGGLEDDEDDYWEEDDDDYDMGTTTYEYYCEYYPEDSYCAETEGEEEEGEEDELDLGDLFGSAIDDMIAEAEAYCAENPTECAELEAELEGELDLAQLSSDESGDDDTSGDGDTSGDDDDESAETLSLAQLTSDDGDSSGDDEDSAEDSGDDDDDSDDDSA